MSDFERLAKAYRDQIGFKRQDRAKDFLRAKDIVADIDHEYICKLNNRLCQILKRINDILDPKIRIHDIELFSDEHVQKIYSSLNEKNLINKLKNWNRRAEDAFFNWMCGYATVELFIYALRHIFDARWSQVFRIGGDNVLSEDAADFTKLPTADLEIEVPNGEKYRVEVQSGFKGINDVKGHKVEEARKIATRKGLKSILVHFDFFNGHVAFLRLDSLQDNEINWIQRRQMEGQKVFEIPQKKFQWYLKDLPPKLSELDLEM